MKKYLIEVNEEQARIIKKSVEEFFRLRMGQTYPFIDDIAEQNVDLSSKNKNHEKIFDEFIQRRDHLKILMRAIFQIAFPPYSERNHATEEMLIAEDIWEAIQTADGTNRWRRPFFHRMDPPIVKTIDTEARVTNGDWVRSLTDEQFAELFRNIEVDSLNDMSDGKDFCIDLCEHRKKDCFIEEPGRQTCNYYDGKSLTEGNEEVWKAWLKMARDTRSK